jgi:hypothetical protein
MRRFAPPACGGLATLALTPTLSRKREREKGGGVFLSRWRERMPEGQERASGRKPARAAEPLAP